MVSEIREVAGIVPDPAADKAVRLKSSDHIQQLYGILFGDAARRVEPDEPERTVI